MSVAADDVCMHVSVSICFCFSFLFGDIYTNATSYFISAFTHTFWTVGSTTTTGLLYVTAGTSPSRLHCIDFLPCTLSPMED
jgi:hypothetical protein